MLYLITYDLHEPEKNYTALQNLIQSLGEANHCLGSVWLLQTRIGVNEVQSEVRKVIDENDRVIITEMTGMPRNGWMNRDVWAWVRAHDF